MGAGYACWAGPADITPYAEYGVSADDNLFRLDDRDTAGAGNRRHGRSDTIRRAALGVLVDWPVSRQTVHVAASASDYDYQRFDQLDHGENQVDTALDYQLGHTVGGTARYENARRLEDFSNRDSTDPDFVRRQRIEIDNRVEITPDWRLRTRVGHLRLDHSLNSEQRFDRREDDVLVAIEYAGSADSVAGLGVEHVDGKFPGRTEDDLFARSFDQNEVFASFNWDYSGQSSLDARLGYTRRDNSGGGDRDFSEPTGRLQYRRALTGKTTLSAQLWRDIYSVDDIDANYLRETALQLGLEWDYSPKLGGNLSFAHRRQKYAALAGDDNAPRRDRVNEAGAELVYRPVRMLAFTLGTRYEWRDASETGETGEDYDALIGSATVRLSLDP